MWILPIFLQFLQFLIVESFFKWLLNFLTQISFLKECNILLTCLKSWREGLKGRIFLCWPQLSNLLNGINQKVGCDLLCSVTRDALPTLGKPSKERISLTWVSLVKGHLKSSYAYLKTDLGPDPASTDSNGGRGAAQGQKRDPVKSIPCFPQHRESPAKTVSLSSVICTDEAVWMHRDPSEISHILRKPRTYTSVQGASLLCTPSFPTWHRSLSGNEKT